MHPYTLKRTGVLTLTEHDESGMLFETFKMCLNNSHDGSRPVAYPMNDKSQSLLKVITLSLKYVKDEALTEINRSQVVALHAHEVKWIVTGHFIFSKLSRICPTSIFLASLSISQPSILAL